MAVLADSPAEITAAALILLGDASDPTAWATGTGAAWPVFVEGEPPTPDQLIKVTDTTGQSDGQEMVGQELLYHYGVQVQVRSRDHPTGFVKADAIRDDMARKIGGTTVAPVGSVHTYLIWCFAKIGPVLCLGKEQTPARRSLFTINALLSARQLT